MRGGMKMERSGWGGGFVIPDRREFWERKNEDENDDRESSEDGRGRRREGCGWVGRGICISKQGTGDAASFFFVYF